MPFYSSTASNFVEIMDTTLRDGEQTEEVSFTLNEKLALAKKLFLEVKVDRMEIASARGSKGEEESCRAIFSWAKEAGLLDRVEVLGFVDYNVSADWISSLGGKVLNLLCKGSKNHCVNQLHKTPQEHFSDIKKTIEYAHSKGMSVIVILEDASNGIREDENYLLELVRVAFENGAICVSFSDTLGILSPDETSKYISKLVAKFPGKRIDFHGHNDYGLAVANSLAAINAGCTGIHVTVNGLGERAGNTPLEAIVPAINDFTTKKCRVDEKKLVAISHLVELFSKRRIEKNHPIVGQVVFTQTAGIHADGDKKGGLYKSKLSSERFARTTRYALGKLSGKASIEISLKQLGITLSKEDLSKVLQKVIELGDKKEFVSKEDLFFIVNELSANGFAQRFKVLDYKISSSAHKKPTANVKVLLNGKNHSAVALGDGGYNAFINALKKIFAKKKLSFPQLLDYEVRIPVGGRTDALVETKTIWKRGNRKIETIGVSTDQVEAAIKATEKMINVALLIGERD